jgi:hypothetical protein
VRWNKVERLRAQDGNIQVRKDNEFQRQRKGQSKSKNKTKQKQHARMTEQKVPEVNNEDSFYLDIRTSSSTSVTTSVMVGRSWCSWAHMRSMRSTISGHHCLRSPDTDGLKVGVCQYMRNRTVDLT